MVSSGLWDEAVPPPLSSVPRGQPGPGVPVPPWQEARGQPLPLALELAPAASAQPQPGASPTAPSSPGLPPPSHSCCCSLSPAAAARAGAARGPQRVPRFGSLCQALSPRQEPLLAPPVSREQLSVRERVRAGCSASGPVQFYCTGANRTEVGTIGGFLALPAPQREPWVGFFVGSFFLCVVFLPSQGRRFPPWSPAASLPPGARQHLL